MNSEHYERLCAGVTAWNEYVLERRNRDPAWRADLREADLREAYLYEADLRGADLREADLREAYLYEAYLREAYLYEADLRGADLRGADLRGDRMSDLKACPICGGEATIDPMDAGDDSVGCNKCGFCVSIEHWQSLPRQSEAVREVVMEIRRGVERSDAHTINVRRLRLIDWASRLESAEVEKVPAEAWEHKVE